MSLLSVLFGSGWMSTHPNRFSSKASLSLNHGISDDCHALCRARSPGGTAKEAIPAGRVSSQRKFRFSTNVSNRHIWFSNPFARPFSKQSLCGYSHLDRIETLLIFLGLGFVVCFPSLVFTYGLRVCLAQSIIIIWLSNSALQPACWARRRRRETRETPQHQRSLRQLMHHKVG